MDSTTPAVRSGGVVGVLAFAGIIASLMQSIVVPLIGELPHILGTSSANAAWIVTVTLLTASVVTPVSGRLGDMYGKRRMLLVCTVPLIAGSIVCALATSLVPMIIGRALQGMGTGIVSLGISALRDILPPDRLGSGIALISSSMGIGGALGMPVAALVVENSDWRALFWSAAGLSALAAVLIWFYVPATPKAAAKPGRFDFAGAFGLGLALICLLLAVSKGADWGWGSATTLGLLAAAIVLLPVWGWWELRAAAPLVDLRVTARPTVLLTNAASIVLGLAMYAQALILPQLLQLPKETGYGLGQSMIAMGLWMAPSGLMMMVVSPLGAKLSAARGPKVTLVCGSIVMGLGYGSSLLLLGTAWGVMLVGAICMIGLALAYGAMPALIMGAVPPSETGSATSFNTLMRAVGTSVSAAIVGVVLSHMTTDFGGRALPSESGFHVGLLIGCGLALAAAAIAACIPVQHRRTEAPKATPAGTPAAARVS